MPYLEFRKLGTVLSELSMKTVPIVTCLLPFPKQTPIFTCLQYRSFKNTVRKGEIARNEQFLLFPQCFLPIQGTFCRFHQIQNCLLQTLSVVKSLKHVVWERVKSRWFIVFSVARK